MYFPFVSIAILTLAKTLARLQYNLARMVLLVESTDKADV